MQFFFDERKAAQAAAWLLRRYGEPMESARLVKLLYLADRQSLIDTGYTVTGDTLVVTDSGPALSNVLELVASTACASDTHWSTYVERIGEDQLTHTSADQCGALSEYERKLLDGLCDRYGSLPESKLRALTSELPEWSKPSNGATPIDPTVILRDAGFSDKAIDEVVGLVASIYSFRRRVRR